jgi:hypothetical protein
MAREAPLDDIYYPVVSNTVLYHINGRTLPALVVATKRHHHLDHLRELLERVEEYDVRFREMREDDEVMLVVFDYTGPAMAYHVRHGTDDYQWSWPSRP